MIRLGMKIPRRISFEQGKMKYFKIGKFMLAIVDLFKSMILLLQSIVIAIGDKQVIEFERFLFIKIVIRARIL